MDHEGALFAPQARQPPQRTRVHAVKLPSLCPPCSMHGGEVHPSVRGAPPQRSARLSHAGEEAFWKYSDALFNGMEAYKDDKSF